MRKDLIRPHPGTPLGADAFRFRHLLIRDATYERLPMATRSELHQRFAAWLEEVAGGLLELDEIAGWHLEQSVRYERELQGEPEPGLSRRAAEHLYAAGRRAGERSDAAAAGDLLARALELTPADEPLRRGSIALALSERLIETGELGRADELLALAEAVPELSALAALDRLEWLVLAQPDRAAQAIDARLTELLERLAQTGDDRGLAKAHMLFFWRHWAANNATLAAAESRLAATHAHTAGDGGLRARALGWHIATLMYGPEDADAIAAALDAIAREEPGPYLAACVELGRAEVERLRGAFDRAAELTDRAFEAFRGLGMRLMAAGCRQLQARVELSRGDGRRPRAAARLRPGSLGARRALTAIDDAGAARAHVRADRRRCRGAGCARARRGARRARGGHRACDHVRGGARLALAGRRAPAGGAAGPERGRVRREDDFVAFQADARLGLARVLDGIGRRDEARAEAATAAELYATKADGPGSAAAGALLRALEGG